mmetsp:Transcript_19411/g.36186  ORF Transcript_19411/g.36186 Transcript_19411/m.36186 type:complete len:544 (+) Transcript_19411:44-1675(+)
MSQSDENNSGNDAVSTPTVDDRSRNLLGDFTPSPTKVPMSLQKDMRGKMKLTTSHTTHSSSASKVLATQYTSESFQKTFKEFGHLIDQRRLELSEMKRSNQLRVSNQYRSASSTPSSDAIVGQNLPSASGTPIIEQRHRLLTPGSSGSNDGASTRILSRRLILGQQQSPTEVEGEGSPTGAEFSDKGQMQEQVQPPTVDSSLVEEMEQQLRGEKQRSMELNRKIEDLHALEEVQRNKAHGLAQDKDRLEAVRGDLEERVDSLERDKQTQHTLLDQRLQRIRELEKEHEQLSSSVQEWRSKFAESEDERASLQSEWSSQRSKVSDNEKQLSIANDKLKKANAELKASSEKQITERGHALMAKQKEFEEMSRDNEALRKEKEALGQQAAVAVTNKDKAEKKRQEVTGKLQSLEKQFDEMEKANKKLMEDAKRHTQQLQKAEEAATKSAVLMEEANSKCKVLNDKQQEVEARCVGLQKAVEAKEQARVALEGQLVQCVKTEKWQRTKHRTKVVLMLMGIWFLLLAVIYEHVVDFHPNTVSPYRITS